MGKLDGKVAFITGAARGQGRSHAVTLAREGADVVISDICAPVATAPYAVADEGDLAETARQVGEHGRRCVALTVDVRDTAALAAAVEQTVAEMGRLDICVANAGICGFARFWEITDEMWQEMIDIDLTGAFKTMRAVTPAMLEQGSGRIIATASLAGRAGTSKLAHYVAAKWGVIGLVKTLALEVAGSKITVNAVCPVAVDTPMIHNEAMYSLFCPDLSGPDRDDVVSRFSSLNPMRVPWLDPADVSDAVLYLASDEARFVSGTTLEISAATTATMP